MKDAIISSLGAVHVLYEIDGHLYTTFSVAVMAGIPVPRALELAWGSQIPDANRRFTAVNASWRTIYSDHYRSLMKTLHSLHGGGAAAITKRRADLKALIAETLRGGGPDWKAGLMVHAYGDSYAHTYRDGDHDRAYDYPLGHARDGHQPDEIGNFPAKYLDYVGNLYQALGGTGDARQHLDRLHRIVAEHANDHHGLSQAVVGYAVELGMEPTASEAVKDRLLGEISVGDVTRTMDEMERRFGR